MLSNRISCEVSILGDIQKSPEKGHEQPTVIDHTSNREFRQRDSKRFFTILIHSVLLISQIKIRLSLSGEDIFFFL